MGDGYTFLLLFFEILFPFAKIGFYLQAKNAKIASIFIINNIFCYSLTAH